MYNGGSLRNCVVLFSSVGHVSVSSGPACPDFCLSKWISIFVFLSVVKIATR